MRISDFMPPNGRPVADLNVVNEAPVPPAIASEVKAAFTLVQLHDRSMTALNRNVEKLLKCQPGQSDARVQMWSQQLRQSGSVMTHCMQALPGVQREQLLDKQKFILKDLGGEIPPESPDAFDAGVKSSNDFFDKLLELIDLIKNGYLAGYEHIIAAYSDFFADFNKEITAKMKDWVDGANDGKDVKVRADLIRYALVDLINKYKLPSDAAVLFPAPGKEPASKEEAEKWRLALGLPESCLQRKADGSYCVVMDTGPLTIMLDSTPSGVHGWVTWNTSKFQSWQTGFNAQEERMKNMLQSFTQKYSNANSYHDNFNKTLSSHLNQFADMLKAMLNF